MHYIRNNICIHANHIRESQSQLWNNFSSPRTLQRSLIRQPHCVNTPYGANSYQRIISREGEIGEKIRACHSFQNTLTSQRRTSQMIRRSPTAYESRICVLTKTLRKIFLVFQLGEIN